MISARAAHDLARYPTRAEQRRHGALAFTVMCLPRPRRERLLLRQLDQALRTR
jgi:hypothetical protein